MATIKVRPNGTANLSIKLPPALGGKELSPGISNVPELYRPALLARVNLYIALLRSQHKSQNLVRDRSEDVKKWVAAEAHRYYAEALGMIDVTVTLNDVPVIVPQAHDLPEAPRKLTLREAAVKYINEKSEDWAPATMIMHTKFFEKFVSDIGGDLDVTEVDLVMIMKWRDQFTGLSAATIRNKVATAASLFKWVEDTQALAGYKSPVRRVTPAVNKEKQATEDRDIWTGGEIRRMLQCDNWLIKLGIYTGARLNELAQLHRDDITAHGEALTLRIATTHPDQSLKTLSSRRNIPLGFPPKMAKEFLAFIGNNERVFPDLNHYDKMNTYRFAASKYVSGVLKKVNEQKSFNGFRHAFINKCKAKGVAPELIKELVGHDHGDITMGSYGKPYDPEDARKVLQNHGIWDYESD